MRIKNRFLITSRNELEIRKVYEIAGVKFPLKRGVQQHDTNEKKIYEIAGEQFLLDPPSHLYILDLFSDTPEYKNLMTYLEEKRIDFHKTDDEVFTEQELWDAPLLRMVPNAHRGGYPQPIHGGKEKDYLSCSFDLQTGCPGSRCTRGLVQNRPLRLSGGIKMGKTNDISGIWWLRDYIVTQKLRDLIEAAELTGVEFWPIVKHGSGQPFEDLFQLKITGVLPPMSPKTVIEFDSLTGYKFACEYGCGARTVKGRVHYRACDIASIPDFALSQEWFGSGLEKWSWPFMSHRAYQLFHDNKIKGIRWYPPAIDE